MKCGVISDLLPLYLEHVCSAESSRLVEEHLKECGQCQRELDRLRKEYRAEIPDIPETLDIEKMARRGTKNLKQKIKLDIMDKAVFVDLVINILLQILFVQWGVQKGVRQMLDNPIPFGLYMVLLVWSVWEAVYLVKIFCRRTPYISEYMSMFSIFMKAGMCIMALIISFVLLLIKAV